jgi:DNA polymerase III sliding clamp (beta) subunit (PCNA family)
METSIKEKTIVTVTASASLFRDLIAGSLTHAGRDESLPRLCGIYIGREEGKMIAVATDRFRLIEGKIESEGEGESKPVRLAYGDAKALSSALAKVKRERVEITLAGDIVSVTVSGSTYTYTAHLDDLPPYRHLFDEMDRPPVDFPHLSVNPFYFSDYGKIIGKRGSVIVRQYGANKPYHIQLTDTTVEWRAMLMPMRVSN